jgi:hypothetical protein
MSPVAAEKTSVCMGSAPLHTAVVTVVPFMMSPGDAAATARQVDGVCPLAMELAETAHTSLTPEPSPHGHV